jgi:serine/threonine protein phosphatase 1
LTATDELPISGVNLYNAVFRPPKGQERITTLKMWKSRQILVPPMLPEGVRIYAIGDVHGRADLLKRLFSRIDDDLEKHPIAQPIQVLLGDYVDRGKDSAAVLDLLIERGQTHHLICLKGNHELLLSEFLENPAVLKSWAQYGALPTLASYGLTPGIGASAKKQAELAEHLRQAMPTSHSQFLGGLKLFFTCGDFFFVHAGVRPGAPLTSQLEEDLLWIRDDFLLHEEPFEKIIVHGHTPVREPEVRPNRINIDTGAYATGRLTCLRLEYDRIDFL